MRRVFLILLSCILSIVANADHITGGEMFYSVTSNSGGTYTYTVTLKLFMRCNSGRMFPDPAVISVFEKGSGSRIQDISTPISSREVIQINNFDPCISNPPTVCYEIAYYNLSVTLPATASGYVLASQVNYRIRGISNLNGAQVGATYTCDIPGTLPASDGPKNNSAVFTGSDLVVVCAGNYFSYSFAARDADGDEIRYSFSDAYASTNGGTNGTPTGTPPFPSVPYGGGDWDGTKPLGDQVKIDPNTGLITGIAPPAGVYVVTVSAEEIRNGQVIAVQRKDLQVNIADCSIAGALLEPDYMLCGNTRTASISNIAISPLIVAQDWEVYDPGGNSIFTSSNFNLNYTFPVNGKYSIRLIVNKNQQCSDTAFSVIYVYPGLVPDFDPTGICITKPTTFTDRTTLLSGTVNSWKWDFGEPTTTIDVSGLQNPVYTYPSMGVKDIRLIVTTTDGCRDTVYKSTTIIDKPPITLAFRDTLICINDRVQLQATGTGNFLWSPPVNMINAATGTPTVAPPVTTKYYVDLETEGCRNKDSVMVRVVNFVTLNQMGDTTICRGDTIRLRVNSDGIRYNWLPAAQVLTPGVKDPLVVTSVPNTAYQVTAIIGGCSATRTIRVATIPYPVANAGGDTMICYRTSAQLHGLTDGNSWQWSPATTLNNPASLSPLATPVLDITNYILTTFNSVSGCPKPSRDTMMVTMLPKIFPFAGRDTVVIINQPLQLTATGGVRYQWSPAVSLSAANIPNPIAIFAEGSFYLHYRVQVFNEAGCSDTAGLNIKVFATLPTVFVPSAFTPNKDGKNDVVKPVAVGMKKIEYFNIYNRWGDLVFTTSTNEHGWDGTVGGRDQGTNTYVWIVKAIDFMGKSYFQKGLVTLIR
jgi:gliding motility-associated-like protein